MNAGAYYELAPYGCHAVVALMKYENRQWNNTSGSTIIPTGIENLPPGDPSWHSVMTPWAGLCGNSTGSGYYYTRAIVCDLNGTHSCAYANSKVTYIQCP